MQTYFHKENRAFSYQLVILIQNVPIFPINEWKIKPQQPGSKNQRSKYTMKMGIKDMWPFFMPLRDY